MNELKQNDIELIVKCSVIKQNVTNLSAFLNRNGISLCVATKVLRLSPSIIARCGLGAYPFYDTDSRNGKIILRGGGSLLCSVALRTELQAGESAEPGGESFAATLGDLALITDTIAPPKIYLDIDEKREGFLPEAYPLLCQNLRASGHQQIEVVCNARCDADAESPIAFFTSLTKSLAVLESFGVSVTHISLGGSIMLPHIDRLADLKRGTYRRLSLRVGESVFVGTVPGDSLYLPGVALHPGLWVRLPILAPKGENTYLVQGGYQCLEPSGISDGECVIRRQWSECALLKCPPCFVVGNAVQIPLTYKGAARLKVHNGIKVVAVP